MRGHNRAVYVWDGVPITGGWPVAHGTMHPAVGIRARELAYTLSDPTTLTRPFMVSRGVPTDTAGQRTYLHGVRVGCGDASQRWFESWAADLDPSHGWSPMVCSWSRGR